MLHNTMDKSVKLKLKNAKKLYQDSEFQASLALIDEILSEDENNYHAIVLKAANCDQLELGDEAADNFWRAIRLDKSNVLAWQGLVQMGSKNMDRFYSTLVCACLELREFHAGTNSGDKQVNNLRLLVELLVRYRLELPLGLTDLRALCQSVLAADPTNPYALEALIRLKIESFLVLGFPQLISPSLVAVAKSDANSSPFPIDGFCQELIHPDTGAQLEALHTYVTSPQLDSARSATAANTVQLGRLACLVASWIQSELSGAQQDRNTAPWTRVTEEIGQMTLNGYRGTENWYRRDLMDFHAFGLLVLATYKSHAFRQCNAFAEQVLDYLQAHQDTMLLEARELSELASVPLSQLTDFINPRPAATPFRLQLDSPPGWSGSVHHCLAEWMLGFRLANAAASEQPALIDRMSRDFLARWGTAHQNSFFWSNTMHTLWLECCLTEQRLDTALHVLFPLEDTETSSSVSVQSILDMCPLQSDWRARLCYLWTAVELVRRDSATDEALSDLVDCVVALVESLPERTSARDHYLLGQLIARLAAVPSICANEARLSQPVQMDRYCAGIIADSSYFANHLSLGRIHRCTGRIKEALVSLAEAKKLSPKSAECTYELALALCLNKEMQKAFDCYADIDQTLFTKDMWLNYGLVALQLRNTLKGVPALQKVIIMEPKNALYWEILGEAYLLRRSYETAVKTLTRSIQLDPKRPLAHVLCGQAYRGLGETVFAIRHLEQGLDYARQASAANQRTASDVRILALKELSELNLFLAYSHLRQGLSGQAMIHWSATLQYLAEVFDCSRVGTRPAPVWAFHFAGSAFSLLSAIHDPDMRVSVPRRLVSVLKKRCVLEPSGSFNNPGPNSVLICQCDCLRLADIYFGCAIKCWSLAERKKCVDSSETDRATSVLERGTLLVTMGLHCLAHARYLRRGHLKTCACDSAHAHARVESLLGLAEAVLKRACLELNDAAESDQQFLDSCEAEEDVAAVSKINQLETSAEKLVRTRLATNSNLRSKAWYGLAELFSFRTTTADKVVDYCLCQAVMMNPQNSEAGTNLALRLLHQGRVEVASSLITHFQAADPENHLVWLASAHLHAIVSAPESISQSASQAKHGTAASRHHRSINQPVLQHLLQAACLGANVQVASQLSNQLFPLVVDTLHDHASPTGLAPDTRSFLRLAVEVTSEALNRALAFEPKNPHLWHNRGLLLQLAGLSVPAAYCLKNALALTEPIVADSPTSTRLRHQLLCAQYLLITYVCGAPDWSVAEQLIAGTGEFNPTLCTSLAEALTKGLTFLARSGQDEQFELGQRCLTDEVSRLANQGSPAAFTSVLLCPTAGAWVALLSLLAHTGQNPTTDAQLAVLVRNWKHASGQLFPCPPQLAIRLSQLASVWITDHSTTALFDLCCACLDWERAYEAQVDQWEESVRDTSHVLADFGRLDPAQRALWAEANATLAAKLGNGFSSGLSHLTRFVAECPSDPLRWTALGRWLLNADSASSSQSQAERRDKHGARSGQQDLKQTDCWTTVLRCVRNAVQLSTSAPSSELLAELLTDCCAKQNRWSAVSSSVVAEDVQFLLACLRRAGALFPQTPGLREQLLLCATSTAAATRPLSSS